jgi:hypothetical protein
MLARMRVLDGNAVAAGGLPRFEFERRGTALRACAVERDAAVGIEIEITRARALVGVGDRAAARQPPRAR